MSVDFITLSINQGHAPYLIRLLKVVNILKLMTEATLHEYLKLQKTSNTANNWGRKTNLSTCLYSFTSVGQILGWQKKEIVNSMH